MGWKIDDGRPIWTQLKEQMIKRIVSGMYPSGEKLPSVRDLAGEAVQAKVREYAAASMNLSTKNEIFSAMVVYGFLSYENGKVRIPNKELMECLEDQLETKQHRCQVEEIK